LGKEKFHSELVGYKEGSCDLKKKAERLQRPAFLD